MRQHDMPLSGKSIRTPRQEVHCVALECLPEDFHILYPELDKVEVLAEAGSVRELLNCITK